MYLVDYHVHTKRCRHACGEDRQYVEAALERGLAEIGFADHIPCYYKPPQAGIKLANRGMFREELDEYVESVLKLRDEYHQIKVKLGMEVDYVPGWEREVEKIASQYPWDYFIGSVHFIPEWDYGYVGNYKDRSSAELFPAYFAKVALAAESKLFDILGHIDLPKRTHAPLPQSQMTGLHRQLAEALGKCAAVIELNTFGIRGLKRVDGIYPDPELIRLCHEQGVRVTMGSDAHKPQDVAADYEHSRRYLKEAGYSQIVLFNLRKPTLVEWGRE